MSSLRSGSAILVMHALRRLPVLALLAWASVATAVPPLVIGDVPTANPGTVEQYAGVARVKSGATEWSLPATEVVLGVSSWQELTLEAPFLVENGGHRGLGDLVLGTKLQLFPEAPARPGLAASVEWKRRPLLEHGDLAERPRGCAPALPRGEDGSSEIGARMAVPCLPATSASEFTCFVLVGKRV